MVLPAATPVTGALSAELLTEAIAPFAVPHVPAAPVVVNVVTPPIQTVWVPVIGVGLAFTVSVAVAKQPVAVIV